MILLSTDPAIAELINTEFHRKGKGKTTEHSHSNIPKDKKQREFPEDPFSTV